MNILTFRFALFPVNLILLLLVLRRTPADIAGLAGCVTAVLVAWFYFSPPLRITFLASLADMVASLPITIMVAALPLGSAALTRQIKDRLLQGYMAANDYMSLKFVVVNLCFRVFSTPTLRKDVLRKPSSQSHIPR